MARLSALASAAFLLPIAAAAQLEDSDVIWTTPSANSAGSMPIGNGEVVLNAWAEQDTGDVLLLIARTDALSEISRVLKLGRVRVHFSPSPFLGADFRQQLILRKGRMEFSGSGTRLGLYVDSGSHTIHLAGSFGRPTAVSATLENWRTAERALPKAEERSAWAVHDAPFPLVESGDIVMNPEPGQVAWCHHNAASVVPKLWDEQSLSGLAGRFDPLINRTFGGLMAGKGFRGAGNAITHEPAGSLDLLIRTHTAIVPTASAWLQAIRRPTVDEPSARRRTEAWWRQFWERSWVFVSGDIRGEDVPANRHPVRVGVDSGGGNLFQGEFGPIGIWRRNLTAADLKAMAGAGPEGTTPGAVISVRDPKPGDEVAPSDTALSGPITLCAWIKPGQAAPGRILDKLTPGGSDGFLFDTHPGTCLRLIVGGSTLTSAPCLRLGEWQLASAVWNPKTDEAALYLNGEAVARRSPDGGSMVTRGYVLQRYCQAIQGRGEFPIKFNGGYYCVEPQAMGMPFNPDWRQWGDCHWFQNVRHMYHPMVASGDWDLMASFWNLYEKVRPLAESRTRRYHGAQGAYFPETMTVFGTYSGGDYGWNRAGLQPKDVQCPWWDDAWNQGPELTALMLDYWDASGDDQFARRKLLPMAESILLYFDTRFAKKDGKIVLDPTQSVETYWEGVQNDMPAVAGLRHVCRRLAQMPAGVASKKQLQFFRRMLAACPDLPIRQTKGGPALAPAEKYADKRSNVENPELYAVWPFREVSLSRPALMNEAKLAYQLRQSRLDSGWGYDGNAAALLGMTEEAARILRIKCANSNPAFRWPATWGPNFDWLPDQNHGGNLLNTTQLMLLQSEPLSEGGAIRLLPAWPKEWDVDFLLHAAGKTTVRCIAKGGSITRLDVTPASRRKDVVWPAGWGRPAAN